MAQGDLAGRAALLRHGRPGISELMATVLVIAITLIAGAAVWGYVNGQAANSENQLGVANATNVNFLNERFVVVDMAVPPVGTSGCTTTTCSLNIWIYNNGNLALDLKQVIIYNSDQPMYVTFDDTPPSSGPLCGSASSPVYGSSTYGVSNSSFLFGPGGTQIPSPFHNPTPNPNPNPLRITLTLPAGCTFNQVTTYYANILGLYGNDVIYSSCDSTSECAP